MDTLVGKQAVLQAVPEQAVEGVKPGGQARARHGRARRLSGFRLPLSGDEAHLFLFAQWRVRHKLVYRGIQGL